MRAGNSSGWSESEKEKDEIAVFMGEYGSYLKMDTCLAYAAALKADSVVDILLRIARHDPRHREVIKQLTKSTTMVFYEPVSVTTEAVLLPVAGTKLLANLPSPVVVAHSQCCQRSLSSSMVFRKRRNERESVPSSTFVHLRIRTCGRGKQRRRATFPNRLSCGTK